MRTSDRHHLLRQRSFGICRQAKWGITSEAKSTRVAVLHPVRSWLPHRVDEVFVLGRLEPIADPPATRCVDDNSIARG